MRACLPLLLEGELEHLDSSHQVRLEVLCAPLLAFKEGDAGLAV